MNSVFKRLSILATAGTLVLAQVVMPVHAAFADNNHTTGNQVYDTPTLLTPNNGNGHGHVVLTICHATASFTNPYSQIDIDLDATNGNGHNDHTSHTGSLYDGTHSEWGDIIPAYNNFPGLNWTAAGQAIYHNDCNIPTPVTAVDGTFVDACGPTFNAAFHEVTTPGVAYHPVVNGDTITVTATADAGYTLTNPTWTQAYTDQLTACEVPPTPIATPSVAVNPICGVGTDTLSYVDQTDDYTSSVTWNQTHTQATIIFTIKDGVNKVFAETNSKTVTITATETDTAECPREAQPCTVHDNLFTKEWSYDGKPMPEAGAYPEDKTALPGTYEFVNNTFFTGIHLTTPAEESYVDGLIDAGKTSILDIDKMAYTTYRAASSTGVSSTLPSYVLEVDQDGNPATHDIAYLFYEPYYNGTVNEGIWQTWDVLNNGNAKWWMTGTGQALHTWNEFKASMPDAVVLGYGFNQGTSNAGADTYIKSMVFDCATTIFSAPGKGGVDVTPTPTPTPVVPATPSTPETSTANPPMVIAGKGSVMPSELPETGASFSPLLIGGFAAAIAYGAIYFAQPKRFYE